MVGVKRTALLLSLVALAMLGAGGTVAAQTVPVGELDAQCEFTPDDFYGHGTPIAQTFVAKKTGKLTSVMVYGGALDGQVQINAVNSLGVPTDDALASATPPPADENNWITVNFPYKDAASVLAGKRYAIVLNGTSHDWGGSHSNSCSDGGFYERGDTGWQAFDGSTNSDGSPAYDARYRTYVSDPDATAPTGTIGINDGARRTASRTVTLALSATDPSPGYWEPASGLDSMRIKNAGGSWTAWQPYAESKNWRLTRKAGTKTVYVQYMDGAGNVSARSSDSIRYRP